MTAGPPHGHPIGYRADCEQCKAERRAIRTKQRRDQRARKYNVVPIKRRASAAPPTVSGEDAAPAFGENESAVRAQCASSARAEDKPGTVMQAVTLSRILDNDQLSALWPQTSRQLHALLTSLDAPRKKSKGRLSAVIALTEQTRNRKAAQ